MYVLPIATTALRAIGPRMGIRLLITLIVGLGALYTMHLLAQDFNKLGNRVTSAYTALTSLGKRDTNDRLTPDDLTQLEIEFEEKIDWDSILRRDPFNCALSLVCQLSAGAVKKNEDANRIYEFISHTIEHTKVPNKLRKSYKLGIDFNKNGEDDFEKCYKHYTMCPYSAETMMQLITFNKFIFG